MNITVTVKFPNFKNIAQKKMDALKARVMDSAQKAVRETTDVFYKCVFDNISMPMHGSFPEEHYYNLGKYYDHPFSADYPEILPHGHLPTWSVHVVYGIMRQELNKKVESTTKSVTGHIGWIYGHSDEVEWVLNGTSAMRERPVLFLTAQDINLHQLLNDNFIKYFKG